MITMHLKIYFIYVQISSYEKCKKLSLLHHLFLLQVSNNLRLVKLDMTISTGLGTSQHSVTNLKL